MELGMPNRQFRAFNKQPTNDSPVRCSSKNFFLPWQMRVPYVADNGLRNIRSKSLLYLFVIRSLCANHMSTLEGRWKSQNSAFALVSLNPLLLLLESSKSLFLLNQIHAQTITTGSILNESVCSKLVSFCALLDSRDPNYCTKILYTTPGVNMFSWNVAIGEYVKSENSKEALVLYTKMLKRGVLRPDNYTYPLLFKVCAKLKLNFMAHEIIGHALHLGFDKDKYVHNAIIHVLVSIGELSLAHKVFEEGCVQDLVSWNSLIHGYARSGLAMNAINVYQEMIKQQVKPDEVTIIGVISSCAQLGYVRLGEEIHKYVEESGFNVMARLANALMDMYVKCGKLEVARAIFDNMEAKSVVSWTILVVGYAKNGMLDSATKLFHDMPEKNIVAWNAIIGIYVQAKRTKEALFLFHKMRMNNIEPDRVTMIHCLSACSQLQSLDVGTWIHHYIEKHNVPVDIALGTALVDMYAKCGNITKALKVFHEMPRRNSLTWTAVIGGLALHGNAHGALVYFSKMIDIRLMPDEITFLGVLSACCHAGLVEEGRQYFSQMTIRFNLSPQLKHYSCMVDLLGRAGLLVEAMNLISTMPIKPDAVVWGALFFACRIHGNLSLGERAASELLKLDPHDSGTYMLLANMYKEANMLEESWRVRKIMSKRGVDKIPGCSLIEVNNMVSEFIVGDFSHPMSDQIQGCLLHLTNHLDLTNQISSILDVRHFPC